MANLIVPVPSGYESITRPMLHDIVKDLIEHTPFKGSSRVLINGESEMAIQGGSWVNANDDLQLNRDTLIHVTAVEEPLEENALTNSMYYRQTPNVFENHRHGIYMKVMYARFKSTLTFKIRCEDRVTAERYQNLLIRSMGNGKKTHRSDAQYDIIIDDILLQLLIDLHKLQENVQGYGEDAPTFLMNGFVKALTMKSTMNGQETLMALTEVQRGIQGTFDFLQTPRLEREGTDWVFNFTYTFNYDRPSHIWSAYPVTIHSQLIPKKWVELEDPTVDEGFMKFGEEALTKLLAVKEDLGYVSIPRFDDYRVTQAPNYLCAPLMQCLTIPNKGNEIFSFRSLEKHGYVLHPKLMEFMETYPEWATKAKHGFVYVTLYENNTRRREDEISLGSDLILDAKMTLSPRNTYHVGVYINLAIIEWPKHVQEAVRKEWERWKDLFTALNPDNLVLINPDVGGVPDPDYRPIYKPGYDYKPVPRPDGSISTGDWNDVITDVTDKYYDRMINNSGGVFRLGIYSLVAARRS